MPSRKREQELLDRMWERVRPLLPVRPVNPKGGRPWADDKACFAGIGRDRIVVDPGFGFGKTAKHNLALLRHLAQFSDLGVPLLAGLSRKSTIGKLTGRPIEERLAGSLAMALLALQGGARILRVHDVKETRDVIAVWQAFNES